MIRVLSAIQDQDSKEIIKATCCFKGCRVLEAENPEDILRILQNESIDIAFVDLRNLFSASMDLLSTINDNRQERSVILLTGPPDYIEEIKLGTANIFYELFKPLNSTEIEHVLDAAIAKGSLKKPEGGCNKKEIILPLNDAPEKKAKEITGIAFKNAFKFVFSAVPRLDKTVTSAINNLDLKYVNKPLYYSTKPVRVIDTLMTKTMKKTI